MKPKGEKAPRPAATDREANVNALEHSPTSIHSSYLNPPARQLQLTPASAVQVRRISWFVDQWIPDASLTLLAGREGIGKSTIACHWAAKASTGEITGMPVNVAYVVTEDDPHTTVVPRLKAAGANLDRIQFLNVRITDLYESESSWTANLELPRDNQELTRILRANEIRLLVLDAAKSVMSERLDGNKDTDIRHFLEPLAATAQSCGCVVLGLVHFGKRETADTGKLILGSAAWSQVARSVLAVRQDPDTKRLFVTNAKANLAKRTLSRIAWIDSVELQLSDGEFDEVGVLRWGEETDLDGSHLLGAGDVEHDPNITDAELWLLDLLKKEQCLSKKQVLALAARSRVGAERTIMRAFKKIEGVSVHRGYPRLAYWLPPGANPDAILDD